MRAGCFHVGVRALIEETAPQIEVVMDIDAHDVYARMRTMLSQDAGEKKDQVKTCHIDTVVCPKLWTLLQYLGRIKTIEDCQIGSLANH